MSVPAFLVTPDKSFQLFAGAGHLFVWLVMMPFIAAAMLRFVGGTNETIFGGAPAGQEAFFNIARIFFASLSFVGALYGAALLSIFFLAQSGLVKNPWE